MKRQRKESSAQQARLIDESGVPLNELAIEHAEELASMANDMRLDVDWLEALTITSSSDLGAPKTVAKAKELDQKRKKEVKKEKQKALTEAGVSSNSTITQLATGHKATEEDQRGGDDKIDPTQGTVDPASKPTSRPAADVSAELLAPIMPLADVQPILRSVDPVEGVSGAAIISGDLRGDLLAGVPVPGIPPVEAQRTPSDNSPIENIPSLVITAEEIHTNHPSVQRDSMASEGIAGKADRVPSKIDYSIDGVGYPTPAPQHKAFTGGSKNVVWAYTTHTAYDHELRRTGVWLFEKPQTCFKKQPKVYVTQGLGVADAPVIVVPAQGRTPMVERYFDGQYLHITANGKVRNDIRELLLHPDFMTSTKLDGYQACEVAGNKVWRHDRDLLNCRMTGCRIQIADSNPANIICLGCGPKTMIRYCSVHHLLADMNEHWKECGLKGLMVKQVIDHTTEPRRFSRLCPALRDRNGFKSYANHRQKVYAQLTYGHYTLFDFANESPVTLMWPDSDPQKKEMESRVERMLNLALFDHFDHSVLVYLYKLLRKCLKKKTGWVIGTQHALKIQFIAEFEFDPTTIPDITADDPLCECEWTGANELPKALHLTTCKNRATVSGKAKHQQILREAVEWMEAEYWILRVWRQQHPTATHWRERMVGKGFPGIDLEEDWESCMGAGWEGYGAEFDSICGPPDEVEEVEEE